MSPEFAPVPAEDKRIGMVLDDRFKIVRKLGEGGMGAVYEGENFRVKRRVAIKCLHPHYASSQELVVRFHREALAATQIGNEHIIEVLDMGSLPDGSIFMVLEFLDGYDYASVLDAEGPQPIERTAHIASQVCEALSAAHAKGIIHRDLKPENVFLIHRSEDLNFVKVLDFGISKFKSASNALSNGMTRTGTTVGTPFYMAPEQAEGRKDIDHRVDLYALGVMMFRALSGVHPFVADNYPMLVVKICQQAPTPLLDLRPDIPEDLAAIIHRLLAKNKDDRFENAASLRLALSPFRPSTSVVTRHPGLSSMPPIGSVPASLSSRAPASMRSRMSDSQSLQFGTTRLESEAPVVGPPPLPSGRTKITPYILGIGITALAVGIGFTMARGPSQTMRRGLLPSQETGTMQAARPAEVRDTPLQGAGTLATPQTQLHPPQTQLSVPQPAEPVRLVHVQIETIPDTADLYLDGARIANPFDGRLPTSSEPRRLEARLKGYTMVVQNLVLQFEQVVRIRMRRGYGIEYRPGARTDAGAPNVVTPAVGAPNVVTNTADAAGIAVSVPESPRSDPAAPPSAEPPVPVAPDNAAGLTAVTEYESLSETAASEHDQ